MAGHAMQFQARTPAQRVWAGILILALHLVVIGALIVGGSRTDWLIFAVVYPLQSIGIGVGMHRYFAHRSFRTGRVFQFILAIFGTFALGNPVSFAGKHRLHHQYCDTEKDVHTPVHGIWACWIGSLLDNGYTDEELLRKVPDLTRFPELMWVHRNARTPGIVLGVIAFLIGGFTGIGIGVGLGSVLLIHQAGAVNYLTHKFGKRRFNTADRSRNNWLVSILTFGDGWHNNHHCYPRSARAGFFWWEIDMFYWAIWLFEKLGLVWDVRGPPAEGYSRRRPLIASRQ